MFWGQVCPEIGRARNERACDGTAHPPGGINVTARQAGLVEPRHVHSPPFFVFPRRAVEFTLFWLTCVSVSHPVHLTCHNACRVFCTVLHCPHSLHHRTCMCFLSAPFGTAAPSHRRTLHATSHVSTLTHRGTARLACSTHARDPRPTHGRAPPTRTLHTLRRVLTWRKLPFGRDLCGVVHASSTVTVRQHFGTADHSCTF